MSRPLVRLDFDGSPAPELAQAVRTVDLSDVLGTRYATEDDTFARLAERLVGENLDGVLLGSGDFHHHALHALRRKREPFSLVLFDNHADLGPSDLITCGAWVEEALSSLPMLAGVLLVGCMPSTLVGLRSPLDRVRWTPLDNDVLMTPLTYMGANGKQFVAAVAAVGDAAFHIPARTTQANAKLYAFALK